MITPVTVIMMINQIFRSWEAQLRIYTIVFKYPIILGNDTIVVTPITVPATHCTILGAFIRNIFLVLPQAMSPNTAFSDQNKKKPCISGLPFLGRPLFLPLIETVRKSTRFPTFYNVISNHYCFLPGDLLTQILKKTNNKNFYQ